MIKESFDSRFMIDDSRFLKRLFMFAKRKYIAGALTGVFLVAGVWVRAQSDTLKKNKVDNLLLKQKGVLGKLAQTIMASNEAEDVQRSDAPFKIYKNRIIRSITIDPLEFGILIGDTSKHFNNGLTRLANGVHTTTKEFVLNNYLFFRENDRLSPYLLASNERFLRDLPFLQDAHIEVTAVKGSTDSVDVTVKTKDVFSMGGSLALHSTEGGKVELREDNFMGWGDRLELQSLYDRGRYLNFGFGAEYVKRNILGSFIDGSAGYLNFNPAFSSRQPEEKLAYFKLEKPLVNPRMRWTYSFLADLHTTANMFNADSVYRNNLQYRYHTFDAWAGWNLSAARTGGTNEFERLRFLLSARVLHQKFLTKPAQYQHHYYYPYANVSAVLASFSLFKLNYYKTQYIYGFGRKEDLPEGLEASFTTGWTKKEGRQRPYFGLAFEQYHLTQKERFINYSLAVGTSVYNNRLEDANLLTTLDYFSRLRKWGGHWKQRSFFSASFARQFHSLLDEPLFMESQYGLTGFEYNYLGGYMRATVKGESVFFSPWQVLYFKLAPFVFSSATLFQFPHETGVAATRFYPAIGGGIRTRNESLIFGTVELRAAWFPKKDAFNNNFLLQLSTNLRFKYNQQFVRRPEFVQRN